MGFEMIAVLNEEQLTEMVKSLQQAQGFRTTAWNKVIAEARQYMLMKQTGRYLERGSLIYVSKSDQPRYQEMFLSNLMNAVENACLEDTFVGIAADPKG